MTTAKLFLNLRKELKLTQTELAKLIGFSSKVFISKVETGVYLPSEKYVLFMIDKFPKKKARIEKVFIKEKIQRSISNKYFPKQRKNAERPTA